MEQVDKVIQAALIEMFKRVGLDFTWEQILDYAKDPEWFWSRAWTLKEQLDFEGWLSDLFYKHLKSFPAKSRKRMVQREVGYFMLMWSWKTEFPSKVNIGEKE